MACHINFDDVACVVVSSDDLILSHATAWIVYRNNLLMLIDSFLATDSARLCVKNEYTAKPFGPISENRLVISIFKFLFSPNYDDLVTVECHNAWICTQR